MTINTDHVIGLYALGEWHDCQQGSVVIRDWTLQEVYEGDPDRSDFYEIGDLYRDQPQYKRQMGYPNSIGEKCQWITPSASTALQWTDLDGFLWTCSLYECKGFKRVPVVSESQGRMMELKAAFAEKFNEAS